MELVQRKRLEIVVESILLRAVRRCLDDHGATGYTILPVKGGRGEAGEWSREGQVSAAAEMSIVVCLTTEERAEAIVEAALPLLSRGHGVISVSDAQVARPEKF